VIDQSILEKSLDYMQKNGSSYGEARFHKLTGFSFTMLNGQLIGASYKDSTGVALRSLANGGLGFSSTSLITKDSILEAASRALKAAKSQKDFKPRIGLSEEYLARISYRVSEKKPISDWSDEDLIKYFQDLYKGLDLDKRINITQILLMFKYDIEEKLLITSDGAFVESYIPRIEVFYSITAEYQGERANRWNQLGGNGGLELLEKLKIADNLEDDSKSLSIYLREAEPSPSGKMDVVLGPEIVGLAMHEAAGHPSEADRVLGREAAQAGLSYRRRLEPGYKIGSEHVTVVDDPTIPGSHGFYLVDDEGVPARPRYLIRNGYLEEYLHNRETAYEMNTHSNASARAKEWWAEPIVRMANTYLVPGDYSLDELLEDVKHGVYIKKYMEWNIDDYRWRARYVGLEAYLIENGRITRPVKNPALEVNSVEFFSSIDAVGKDLSFYAGTCGKGEPGQGVPVWFGGPHIHMRGVRII